MERKRIFNLIIVAVLALLLLISWNLFQSVSPATAQQRPSLTVSAAISLAPALTEIKTVYQSSNPKVNITYNFGASGALAQQIQQGAPVDVFFSAAGKQMDALQQANLLLNQTRRNLLTNRLVLIAPKNSAVVRDFKQLTDAKIKKIAIGEPNSVPVGQYAQEMLTKLGLWQQIKPKLVFGNNVRQVLTFVESGNVDAGIVYVTDAKTSDKVTVQLTAATNLHSPIVYPLAVIRNSRSLVAAKKFIEFLAGDRAKIVFQKYGFGLSR
ncbi:MAG: molybdate ABC transporter substrate-binding protein [Microcoleus sp. PH2017_10_PVI_O_A]|uniref:molybdate ABC transporter substrate-binding protein n=1 Tax=unclassified Microcoleus TaxID=2642155 RepID=UPI001D25B010|nr:MULTISPECIES: molybdate ABC transporter substrate-binding protein [unclassified Microcoleus]TAE79907.1 MAG: molybdate ABC transporter substrate-binding protein [Oscillatoriales cyanobacterium]MCC3407884.1 molybdate ABC transporter substrate-binding protein [Microcoleus sp. PH2017_10_PVI_O_A]MCC3462020.1 molybdate ABC transporter substrate-binding protein [Microcoleus sp. PH2017_11_PCY_U_A]MCC3480488.1 molybdate ABC transporter substrate-binding protein [Microcoleus sp. PH2017_12_PCY_D_A]MCC